MRAFVCFVYFVCDNNIPVLTRMIFYMAHEIHEIHEILHALDFSPCGLTAKADASGVDLKVRV